MTAPPLVDELTDRILALAREVLRAPDLEPDDELTQQGGTSLSLVRIIARTHDSLGVDIDPRDLAGGFTARGLAEAAQPLPPRR